jgi:parallel beta-helix repeat protein
VVINGFTITGCGSNRNDAGIEFNYCSNGLVYNNNISYNDNYGIRLYGWDGHKITDNILYENTASAISLETVECKILNNIMTNCGITINGWFNKIWNSHTIDDKNTVNGKPVIYWTSRNSQTVPTGAGQVILANCTNVVVQDEIISSASSAIQVGYSSNIHILNNNLSFNGIGIRIQDSEDNIIKGNTVENSEDGIVSVDCLRNNITDNIVTNCDYGIGGYSSYFETVFANSVESNDLCGIVVYRSEGNIVKGNKVTDNLIGIELNLSDYQSFQVSYNNITNNGDGIFIYETENSSIFGNRISFNTNGVNINELSHNNHIFDNEIKDNFCGFYIEDLSLYNNITDNTLSNNEVQFSIDTDLDGVRDHVDMDDDNDNVLDEDDAFPTDPTESEDADRDGIGNNKDDDDDNDGHPDNEDLFPFDRKEWSDKDGDGVGDNSDLDNNGNYIPDFIEIPLIIAIILIPICILFILNRRIRGRKKNKEDSSN